MRDADVSLLHSVKYHTQLPTVTEIGRIATSESRCHWSPSEDLELSHKLCPVIITSLGSGDSATSGQVWTNFRYPGVSWGYINESRMNRSVMNGMERALNVNRPDRLRAHAQDFTTSTSFTNDLARRHQYLYQGALDYFATRIGAPDILADPSNVLHLQADLETINCIRGREGFPPLPLPDPVMANPTPTTPESDSPTTEFDADIAASEQRDIDNLDTLQAILEPLGAWPLLPFCRSEAPAPAANHQEDHPYENTSLATVDYPTWSGADDQPTARAAFELGIEDRIFALTGKHIHVTAPTWSGRDTSWLDSRGVDFGS